MGVIAISRQVAALGDEIAAEVAEKLGYKFINRQELEKRIVTLGFPAGKLKKYDEKKPGFFASLVKDRDEYLHYLQTAVLEAAENKIISCVENYAKDFVGSESPDRPRMNILLWGPPGSGKTEFVKYLGEKTGRRVIVKKGSDILGMYVGQSEQNIRDAFREAEADHAILFFDEIDGLLQSREGASQSWQVSQVNELLQQMEEFDGIMVAATNFFRNLDPAVMRRFTFKLEFDFLDGVGKKHFFEHMFKTSLTDAEVAELERIPNLCPGDFRTVRQSLYYLGGAATNADRLEALRAESEVKPKDGLEHHMGF